MIGISVAVVLAIGTMFFHSFFYTESSTSALWQAPIAAVVLTLFLSFWCWLNVRDPRSTGAFVPYDTVFRFSNEVRLAQEPVGEFVTVRKGGEQEKYQGFKIAQGAGHTVVQYYQIGKTGEKGKKWTDSGAEEIIIEHDGKTYHFKPQKAGEGDFPYYLSEEGWVMMQYDTGVTGLPRYFSFWLVLVNVFLNVLHLGLWFVCLWLVLRFQWSHALGLAFVIWLTMTLFVVQPLLTQAALTATLPAS
jgi:hypothetical protein